MTLNDALLIVAALFPAIALCIYIFKKDRAEKEPISLLLGLFLGGVIIAFPAAKTEDLLTGVLNSVFSPFAVVADETTAYLPSTLFKLYNAIQSFAGIALVEEGLKWLVLFFITRKNKNFNSLFDGLIYAVFVSLGFAALENVLYVLSYGWTNALIRAATAVPGHMFNAVLMGCYYSFWHMNEKAKALEKTLKEKQLIPTSAPEFSGKKDLALSIVIPVSAHGLYDYCCLSETWFATVALYGFLLFLYIYCFKKIRQMSKSDMKDDTFVLAMLLKKYPQLIPVFRSAAEAAAQNQDAKSEALKF